MVAEPPLMPVTMPVDEPAAAFDGLLLAQVPPVVPMLARAVVAPWQTVSVPEIAVGRASTVTTAVLVQPELAE